MITKEFPIGTKCYYPFSNNIHHIVFFDIETTGFSAFSTQLYLIGCCYYRNSSFHIIQWFAEKPSDEKLVLSSFFEFIKGYKKLIHFNGSGFDIPYLINKCELHKLDYNFDHINSLDIYRKTTPYKRILKLENYKLKTIEKFLNIDRKDTFSGGELIKVYEKFLKMDKSSPDAEDSLHELLLHNEDDLKGLLRVSPILCFSDIFERKSKVIDYILESEFIIFKLQLPASINFPIEFSSKDFDFKAFGDLGSLKIRTYSGVLKCFYENYMDYYYLPAEDTAIHKSLGSFVERDHRQRAKASNCYTKKQGQYMPQFEPLISPFLKTEYKDKISYINVDESLLDNKTLLNLYINHIIKHLPTIKV